MHKHAKQLNTTDLPAEELKLYDRIEILNQELICARKIEADLERKLLSKQQSGEKKSGFINQAKEHYQKAAQEAERIMK
jgi:hypothetical protein